MATVSYTAKTVYYDEEAFIETFDGLAADESLRERIADGITEQLILVSDLTTEGRLDQLGSLEDLGIETEVDEADTDAFGQAIREEQRAVIHEAATAVVNDAEFADIFVSALRESHGDLLDAFADNSDFVTSSNGEVTINLVDLFPPVQARIANQAVTQPVSNVDVPRVAGDFKVLDKTVAFGQLWDLIRNAQNWSSRLITLSIIALALAVAVSDRRPWAIITYGTAIASLAVVIIVTMYVAWALIPLLVDVSETSNLVATVYRTAIGPLVRNEVIVAAAGIGLAIAGSLARWVWPDDWVYEHHDAGTGPVAVRAPYPTQQQQVFPQYPQYPGYQQPAPQLPPQTTVFRPVPAEQTPVPFEGRPVRSLAPAPPPLPDGPTTEQTPAVEADGWDYDAGEW